MVPIDEHQLRSRPLHFFIATERMNAGGGNTPSEGWRYSRLASGPQVFDVVLYPYAGPDVPDVSVKRLDANGADTVDVTALEVHVGQNTDYAFISRSGAKRATFAAAQLELDGEIAVVRVANGRPIRVSGANVTKVSFGGKLLLDRNEPAAEVDLVVD